MKIVRVMMHMPYRYGEKEPMRESDAAKVVDFLTAHGIAFDPDIGVSQFLCTSEQAVEAMAAFPHKYDEVHVEKMSVVYDAYSEAREQLDAVLNRMNIAAARLEAQSAYEPGFGQNPGSVNFGAGWNGHTRSPLSGPVLHSFNETMLCEDYCTDALQSLLAEGWRIIAVCPQESRRPDYVLGRCLEAPTIRTSALRG